MVRRSECHSHPGIPCLRGHTQVLALNIGCSSESCPPVPLPVQPWSQSASCPWIHWLFPGRMQVVQVWTPCEDVNRSPGRKVSAGFQSVHDCCTGTLLISPRTFCAYNLTLFANLSEYFWNLFVTLNLDLATTSHCLALPLLACHLVSCLMCAPHHYMCWVRCPCQVGPTESNIQ